MQKNKNESLETQNYIKRNFDIFDVFGFYVGGSYLNAWGWEGSKVNPGFAISNFVTIIFLFKGTRNFDENA